MKRVIRFGFYLLGMAVLCLGLTLNSLAGWGGSPIISVAWVLSYLLDVSFGAATALYYALLVGVQILIRGKGTTVMEFLQLPVCAAMGLFLDFFGRIVVLPGDSFAIRAAALAIGITCTAIGPCTALNMRLAPSPADGLVQTIADATGKNRGFCKNMVDISFSSLTAVLSLLFVGELVGVGVGTVISVITAGRIMALFDHFTKKKICALAGVSPDARAIKRQVA